MSNNNNKHSIHGTIILISRDDMAVSMVVRVNMNQNEYKIYYITQPLDFWRSLGFDEDVQHYLDKTTDFKLKDRQPPNVTARFVGNILCNKHE